MSISASLNIALKNSLEKVYFLHIGLEAVNSKNFFNSSVVFFSIIKLWGGEFWTDGYYISTVGMHGNETVIKYYVKNQGKEKEYKQLHYQKPRTQMTLF
jgi:REP element-mobilizing transposase RayT